MNRFRKNGVMIGGCLDFKIPAGLSSSAMSGLTKKFAYGGQPVLNCEHQFVVPIDGSVGAPFYFYHIRKGAQEKDFIVGELQKMHIRPASMDESASLTSLGFHKLHSAVACIDPKSILFMDLIQLVCLTSTVIAGDQRFHPILKCKAGRDMWMDISMCGESLPLDALIPVTDRGFDSWNQ